MTTTGPICEIEVTIVNELGMHARAATKFVQMAAKFQADVLVEKDGQEVNGKSIMGVLMLVASKGSTVTLRAKGDKAQECIDVLAKLIEDKFGEDK